MHGGKKTAQLRELDALGNVLMSNSGSVRSCGRVTYLIIVVDQVHPFTTDDGSLFQQDNVPCHTVHIVEEQCWEYDEGFKVLPWPTNSLIPIQPRTCRMCLYKRSEEHTAELKSHSEIG